MRNWLESPPTDAGNSNPDTAVTGVAGRINTGSLRSFNPVLFNMQMRVEWFYGETGLIAACIIKEHAINVNKPICRNLINFMMALIFFLSLSSNAESVLL